MLLKKSMPQINFWILLRSTVLSSFFSFSMIFKLNNVIKKMSALEQQLQKFSRNNLMKNITILLILSSENF